MRLHSINEKALRIIVVGAGKVGQTLVEQLCGEGNNITLIDKNANAVENLTARFDIMPIIGNGASYSVLMDAGIEKTDLLIAVTDSDELNLLCCAIAKQVGNCATIARVRTPDYSREVGYITDRFGLAMVINPDQEAAKEVSRMLSLPQALEVSTFAGGKAELIKIQIPKYSILDGKRVMELGSQVTDDIVICAVERGKEVYIPGGNFLLKEGDMMSFATTRPKALKFLAYVGLPPTTVRDCMIIGGGNTAYYLAQRLLTNTNIKVKIIEKDSKRAAELTQLLPKAVIIEGDGSNEEVLREEGIESTDAFVPLTGMDEENILLTMHCRQVSRAKAITKINRITFTEVINGLQLGSVIYPRYITSEAIIAYARAKRDSKGHDNIETLYHLFDHRVEAIEFNVTETFPAVNVALKDLKLKDNVLIAFISRKGKIIFPGGTNRMSVGDTVMIVTKQSGFTQLTDILAE